MRGPRRALVVVGVLLTAFGLGCLGWVGWQLWGTGITAQREFRDQTRQLERSWHTAPTDPDRSAPASSGGASDGDPAPGTAIALLRVPRFGAGYVVPVLEGTTGPVLARGVGHYRGTAAPGAVGNFAIAGHRITHGEPFARLLELRRGDQVVVETRTATYTYAIDTPPATLTVQDTAGWVLDPVPGRPQATPTRRLITLTTCQDLFRSPNRSVAFGHLIGTRTR